jgi:hypothetical protein
MLVQLFACLEKADEDVQLLVAARENQDAMEIDITGFQSYYEALRANTSKLFWEISQNISPQGTLTKECFKHIVKDCQIIGSKIWTAIDGLRYDTGGKDNALTEQMD